MLQKNKINIGFHVLFFTLLLSSCCEEPIGPGFGYGFNIYPDSEDNIQSNIIKTREIMLNDEPYTYIYNVAYSLRNDDKPNEILKQYITPDEYPNNIACIVFTTDKNEASRWDYIYVEDEEEFYKEMNAELNNTLKYFIIINDPDLDGYDSNYETVKKYLHSSEEKTIYLGANTSK